jgi:hypothetical protein
MSPVIKGTRFYTGIKLGFSFYGKGAQILLWRVSLKNVVGYKGQTIKISLL